MSIILVYPVLNECNANNVFSLLVMSYMRFPKLPKRGRRPQSAASVKFREEWPMKLDNEVSTRGGKAAGRSFSVVSVIGFNLT